MHGAKGYMPSVWGIETPGSFGQTRASSMIVPECVQTASNMACVEMEHGPTQTGVVRRVTDGVILETAPAPWDAACEVRSVFCERPKRGRLSDQEPALKRSALDLRPGRGRLKWRQMLSKFGKHMSACKHVYGARRAACREYCLRDESRRHLRAREHGKPCGAVRVRVTSSRFALHEGQVSSAWWLTWWMAQKRTVNAIDRTMLRSHASAKHRGRASCKPPPWRRKARRALPRVDDHRPGCSEHPHRGKGALVRGRV